MENNNEVTTNNKKNKNVLIFSLVAIIVFLCISLLFVIFNKNNSGNTSQSDSYHLTIDINPSVELDIKNGNIVSDIDKLNSDAETLFNNYNFDNMPLEKVVDTIITESVRSGMLKDDQAILWSVDSNQGNQSLLDGILNNIKTPLMNSNINANIYNQVYNHDNSLEKQAKTYGISEGKMAFIKRVISNDNSLVESELAKMTIGDIDSLVRSKNISFNNDDIKLYRYDNNVKNIVSRTQVSHDNEIQTEVNEIVSRYNALNSKLSTGDRATLKNDFNSLKNEINSYKSKVEELFNSKKIADSTKNTLLKQLNDISGYIDNILQSINTSSAVSPNTPQPPNITVPAPNTPPPSNNGGGNVSLGDINGTISGYEARANKFTSTVNAQNYYSYKAQMEQLDREIDIYDDKLEFAVKTGQITSQSFYGATARLDAVEDILDRIEDRCEYDFD